MLHKLSLGTERQNARSTTGKWGARPLVRSPHPTFIAVRRKRANALIAQLRPHCKRDAFHFQHVVHLSKIEPNGVGAGFGQTIRIFRPDLQVAAYGRTPAPNLGRS